VPCSFPEEFGRDDDSAGDGGLCVPCVDCQRRRRRCPVRPPYFWATADGIDAGALCVVCDDSRRLCRPTRRPMKRRARQT